MEKERWKNYGNYAKTRKKIIMMKIRPMNDEEKSGVNKYEREKKKMKKKKSNNKIRRRIHAYKWNDEK